MLPTTRRSFAAGAILFFSGCTGSSESSGSSAETDENNGIVDDDRSLEELFQSAENNHEESLAIVNVDNVDGIGYVDFLSPAETMDDRAEEMSIVIGIYSGIVDLGHDIPVISGFGLDPQTQEDLWAFRVEEEWVDAWVNGEEDSNYPVQKAAETYEEYSPPGE